MKKKPFDLFPFIVVKVSRSYSFIPVEERRADSAFVPVFDLLEENLV